MRTSLVLTICLAVHCLSALAQDTSNLPERVRQAARLLDTQREQRIAEALKRSVSASDCGINVEDNDYTYWAAINTLGEERSVEAIDALIDRLEYRGVDFHVQFTGLRGFRAAIALGKIGAPAIPRLLEEAANRERETWQIAPLCVAPGYFVEEMNTDLLLLLTLYAAAGEQSVIDERLKEIAKELERSEPRTERSEQALQNLRRMIALGEQMQKPEREAKEAMKRHIEAARARVKAGEKRK